MELLMSETTDLIIRLSVANDPSFDRLISAIERLNRSVDRLLDSEHAEDAEIVSALDHIVKASEEIDVKVEDNEAANPIKQDFAAACGFIRSVEDPELNRLLNIAATGYLRRTRSMMHPIQSLTLKDWLEIFKEAIEFNRRKQGDED